MILILSVITNSLAIFGNKQGNIYYCTCCCHESLNPLLINYYYFEPFLDLFSQWLSLDVGGGFNKILENFQLLEGFRNFSISFSIILQIYQNSAKDSRFFLLCNFEFYPWSIQQAYQISLMNFVRGMRVRLNVWIRRRRSEIILAVMLNRKSIMWV